MGWVGCAIMMGVMGEEPLFYETSKKWVEGFVTTCYENGLTEKQAAAALDFALEKQYEGSKEK